MKVRHDVMPILRLAYSTLFLIALMAVFVLWSQVGGQSHLDLVPWPIKLALGVAAAYGVVRATAASVSGDRAWNGHMVRWLGLTLAVLAACGYASYYAHMNLEESDDSDQPQDTTVSRSGIRLRLVPGGAGFSLPIRAQLGRLPPTTL
jgi:protein-S-isoprenylcysteine O-methyltransferase Ste14